MLQRLEEKRERSEMGTARNRQTGETVESAHLHAHSSPHAHTYDDYNSRCDGKSIAFFFVGGATFIYCMVEIIVALRENSLTLLSDGFHNFSDVIAIAIAYTAAEKAKSPKTDTMSFGWVRTEILGGLVNGCFLLSLSLYIILEAIPRLIPALAVSQCDAPPGEDMWYIYVAASGLAINTIGTLIFHFTGQGHMHSHAGGGGHGGHGHAHDDSSGSSYHSLVDSHCEEDYGGDIPAPSQLSINDKVTEFPAHGHSHESHGHAHDMNVYAVFLHYLGDMLSSFFVLVAGLLLHFFKDSAWTDYLDPVFSLLIVGIILFTTIPLVNQCSMILLQSTPPQVSLSRITREIGRVKGVRGTHDLHVWQLVDGMSIGSVHVVMDEETKIEPVFASIKAVFHKYGVHSTAIQPEFTQIMKSKECEQNCVEECAEDWCCKKEKDQEAQQGIYGSSSGEENSCVVDL